MRSLLKTSLPFQKCYWHLSLVVLVGIRTFKIIIIQKWNDFLNWQHCLSLILEALHTVVITFFTTEKLCNLGSSTIHRQYKWFTWGYTDGSGYKDLFLMLLKSDFPSNTFLHVGHQTIGKMRVILWTIAAFVFSIANGKFLLWQNDPYFTYRLWHDVFMSHYNIILPQKNVVNSLRNGR